MPFEVAQITRNSVMDWVNAPEMRGCGLLLASRFHVSPRLLTRQYARRVRDGVSAIGLDASGSGTRSLGRTKATLILCHEMTLPFSQGDYRRCLAESSKATVFVAEGASAGLWPLSTK